jgi:hypothetical protein
LQVIVSFCRRKVADERSAMITSDSQEKGRQERKTHLRKAKPTRSPLVLVLTSRSSMPS